MATKCTKTLSMKLLVDTKAQRVLFAEASKDVVDFLFSLLALPLGAAVKLLRDREDRPMVGSVGDIYASVETLDAAYAAPGASKDALLASSPAVGAGASSLLGFPEPAVSSFECGCDCRGNTRITTGVKCQDCGGVKWGQYVPVGQRKLIKTGTPCTCMHGFGQKTAEPCQDVPARQRQAVAPAPTGGGFVQGIVTYTVTDSLAVAPMSPVAVLLSTFAARDLGAAQEKAVQLGHTEALEIADGNWASLLSRTVLTDVFLRKKEPHDTA